MNTLSKVSMEGNDEFIVVPAMPVSAEDNENNGDEPYPSAVLVTEVSTENVNDQFSLGKSPFSLLQLVYPSA